MARLMIFMTAVLTGTFAVAWFNYCTTPMFEAQKKIVKLTDEQLDELVKSSRRSSKQR